MVDCVLDPLRAGQGLAAPCPAARRPAAARRLLWHKLAAQSLHGHPAGAVICLICVICKLIRNLICCECETIGRLDNNVR
jgi:hypothetical protein